MASSNDSGPFAVIFAVIGLLAGGAAGLEVAGGIGMLAGAVVLSVVGGAIGGLVDMVVAWLIYVLVVAIAFMVNAAIRQFVIGLIASLVGASSDSAPSAALLSDAWDQGRTAIVFIEDPSPFIRFG